MFKIDVYPHIITPKYAEVLYKKTSAKPPSRPLTSLHDLEARFRIMDHYEGYVQILNISSSPAVDLATPEVAAELAQIANDEMAELLLRYPDRFLAAVACLPMNNMVAALEEVDRAIIELGFKGVQITTTIMDKPIDSPEFEPLFEKMNNYNLPILMHPRHVRSGPRAFSEEREYIVKDEVGYWAQSCFNWPFETTLAMGRIVFSGMLDKYTNLKIITHHCGGLTPYHADRIQTHLEVMALDGVRTGRYFTKKPINYYKMIYGDTVCRGNAAELMCGYAFFGADHMLFGTDMPHDSQGGERSVRDGIQSVEEMPISEEDKKKIFEDNAKEIFRLPI